jgi:hypothetical protein
LSCGPAKVEEGRSEASLEDREGGALRSR